LNYDIVAVVEHLGHGPLTALPWSTAELRALHSKACTAELNRREASHWMGNTSLSAQSVETDGLRGDRVGGYPSGGTSGSVVDVHEDGTVRYVLARARGAACFARRIALTLVSYFGPRPCSARRVTVVHDGASRYRALSCR